MRKTIQLKTSDRQILKHLGQRIRRARLRRNLSQVSMADRCDVTPKTYQSLEAGSGTVSFALLVKSLAVFGLEGELGKILDSDPVGDALSDYDGRKTAANNLAVADF